MKKLFLGFAAVAMLASCSKNEVIDNPAINGNDDPSRISFVPTSGKPTRAVEEGAEALEGLTNGFEVFAVASVGSGAETNLFNGVNTNNYKFSNSTWDWDTKTEDKKWPTDVAKYPIEFVAAHNYAGGVALDYATLSTAKEITIEAMMADQKDQMSAVVRSGSSSPVNGKLALKFQHMLSSIQFALKSTPGYTVDIQGIRIVYVTDANSYTFRTQTWTGLTPVSASTDVTTAQPAEYTYRTALTSVTGNKKAQSIIYADPGQSNPQPRIESMLDVTGTTKHNLMLMPQDQRQAWDVDAFKTAVENWDGQDMNAWTTTYATAAAAAMKSGAYIEVIYKMRNEKGQDIVGWTKGNNKNLNEDGTQRAEPIADAFVKVGYALDLSEAFADAGIGATKFWSPSKRYTYNITLGTPDASNGTVLDPDYKDEDGGDTNTPVDNPKTKPGDPISKLGYIGFDVTVDPWQDGGATDIK